MRRVGLLLLVLLMGVLVSTGVASAQELRIGVVDLSIIISESAAGREANEQLNQLVERRRIEIAQKEEAIVALETELNNIAENLSDEQVTTKQEELNELISEYLQLIETYESEIQATAEAMRRQILAEIGAVLQWYGDNRGYSLIIDASAALYYRRVIDLTYDIIREYDALRAAGQIRSSNQQEAGTANP